MGYITSGNYTVDTMAEMNITGNVVPMIWYKTITRANGKPHLLAITLLSDITYWYRPSEVRDEASGQVTGWKKRFKGKLLQKTYQQYAELLGESKRSIKAAFDVLEELGVIKRIFHDETCENGMVLYNLMYIALDVDVLYALTYPEHLPEQESAKAKEEIASNHGYGNGVIHPIDIGGTEKCISHPQKNVGGGTKFCTTPLQNSVIPPTKICTHTEITTENTTKSSIANPIYQSNLNIIRNNIDYNCLKFDMESQGTGEEELLDEMVELIAETISSQCDNLTIGGKPVPFEQVKQQFLRLNAMHIRYVLLSMRKNTSSIRNIRAYLLTALYNAPHTITHFYQAEVNHTMCGKQDWYGDG